MTHTTRILIEQIGDQGYTMTTAHVDGQDVVEAIYETTGVAGNASDGTIWEKDA